MLWQGAMVALAQDLGDFRAKTKPPTAPPLRKAVSTFEANPSHRFHFVRTGGLENGGCGGGGSLAPPQPIPEDFCWDKPK